MFTGIVEATGKIAKLDKQAMDYRIEIQTESLDMSDVKLGDSIASNGVCLTVVAKTANSFAADVSAETIAKTAFADYQTGHVLNLEKALMPTSRLGGHIVSGHVDGLATIKSMSALGRATEYWLSVPPELSKYIAVKGSVTLDGISLTVNDVKDDSFKITIVPHTSEQTTIDQFKVGQKVNMEVDVLARYLERLVQAARPENDSKIDMSFLAKNGFL